MNTDILFEVIICPIIPSEDCHTLTDFPTSPALFPALAPIQDWVQQQLTDPARPVQKRYLHVLGVMEATQRLCTGLGWSGEQTLQACTAALLHDNAKLWTPQKLLEYCQQFGLFEQFPELDAAYPQTLHAWVGAHRVKQELGIVDSTILNAMRWHTTGFELRDPDGIVQHIAAVVYVADKIEWHTRPSGYVAEMTGTVLPQWLTRAKHWRDSPAETVTILQVWQMMHHLLDNTLTHLRDHQQAIHPLSLQAHQKLTQYLLLMNPQ